MKDHTLYYPQTYSAPASSASVLLGTDGKFDATKYHFEKVSTSMLCGDDARVIDGVKEASDGYLHRTKAVTEDECKAHCLGTPRCVGNHGFSYMPTAVDGTSFKETGKVLAGDFQAYALTLWQCYQKCLTLPWCPSVGFSYYKSITTKEPSSYRGETITKRHCFIPNMQTGQASVTDSPADMGQETDTIFYRYYYAAVYRFSTCALPKFDAASPCRRTYEPSGRGGFWSVVSTEQDDGVKTDAFQLLSRMHPTWGIRNTVYHAEAAFNGQMDYAAEAPLRVPLAHVPSGQQIGPLVVRPSMDLSAVASSSESHTDNDRRKDEIATFCRHQCAQLMGCNSFKVDLSTVHGSCALFAASSLTIATGGVAHGDSASAGFGLSYSMVRAYEAHSVATAAALVNALMPNSDYELLSNAEEVNDATIADLLVPVEHSHAIRDDAGVVKSQLYSGGVNPWRVALTSNTVKACALQCLSQYAMGCRAVTLVKEQSPVVRHCDWTLTKDTICHSGYDSNEAGYHSKWSVYPVHTKVSLQSCKEYCIKKPECRARGFSFDTSTTAAKDAKGLCRFPANSQTACAKHPYTGSTFYELKPGSCSGDVGCHLFPDRGEAAAAHTAWCDAALVQYFSLSGPSAIVKANRMTRISEMIANSANSYSEVTVDGPNGRKLWGQALADTMIALCTAPDEPTDFAKTPSYRVLHPVKHAKVDIGIYAHANDLGDFDTCGGDAEFIQSVEVNAWNALVECANHCARAYGSNGLAKVCSGFTVQSPNRCSMYTSCEKGKGSGKAAGSSPAASYRVRTNFGPFLYAGQPGQHCEPEYELSLTWSAIGGGVDKSAVVQKSASSNAVQDCMDHCTAHNAHDPARGCGGFSVADNGACRLLGPCKTTSSVVLTPRPLFQFHSKHATEAPLNKVIDPPPIESERQSYAAWAKAADAFCAATHGEGYRAATRKDAEIYRQFGGAEDRRWGAEWGWCTRSHPNVCTADGAGWGKANNAMYTPSQNYPVCFDGTSSIKRHYQLPNSVSVYSRVPKLNVACSSTPMLSSPTADTWRGDGLLEYCASQCNARSLGTAMPKDNGASEATLENSGCVGFTVSTVGHCELHAACNAASQRAVAPAAGRGFSAIWLSFTHATA
tara:strand:- start:3123 stop:6506 length:3384 start_codon:yes stop_codon:yes gene_type:complete